MPGIICINFKKFCNITKYIKNINHVRIVYDYECSLYIMKKYIFKYHNMYCISYIYIYDKYIRTPCIKLLH